MYIEIMEITYGKALELIEHIFPIHKGMVKLDEKFFCSLQDAVVFPSYIDERPVFIGDFDNSLCSFEVYFQGRGSPDIVVLIIHVNRLMRRGEECKLYGIPASVIFLCQDLDLLSIQ
jgi:hypothetical protein